MFKKIKKNNHVIDYITEKCHTKYYTSVKTCKIFCDTSIFSLHIFNFDLFLQLTFGTIKPRSIASFALWLYIYRGFNFLRETLSWDVKLDINSY